MKITAALLAVFLAAQCGAAEYTNQILAIGVGARPLGMGGAFVAVADDSSAVYWNPAGLAQVAHIDLGIMEEGKALGGLGVNNVDSNYMAVSGALNVPDIGTFGVGLLRFGLDSIPYVPNQTLIPGQAPITEGTFQDQDMALMASYGRQIIPGLDAGLTAKYLNGGTQGVQGGDAGYNYGGADVGLLCKLGQYVGALQGLSLGMNLQDLVNTGVQWQSVVDSPTETVDPGLKIGAAYSPAFSFLQNRDRLTVLTDVDVNSPNSIWHIGCEYWYHGILAIRVGARHFEEGLQSDEYSGGLSGKISFLQIDYAFVNYELTPMQFLTLDAKF